MTYSNLIDSPGQRSLWIARVHAMITTCLELETAISIAMMAHPTGEHAMNLISADVQLGAAVAALGEAANRVARLKQ